MRLPCTEAAIGKAVSLLRQGEVVAFPTETVYGLGADARQISAIQKLFAIKARPQQKPLSLLIPNREAIFDWAENVSLAISRLGEVFWPGPLTMVVTHNQKVLPVIVANTPRIGLRVPAHPVTQALLKGVGHALAVPSANMSGQLSPTRAEQVEQSLGDKIPLILDGGECSVGIASTVIDMTGEVPLILRQGAISQAGIEAVLKNKVLIKAE